MFITMTNRIQEHKIIAMQAIIFVSLLVVLSFILEGCTLNQNNIDKVEIDGHNIGYEVVQGDLFVALS